MNKKKQSFVYNPQQIGRKINYLDWSPKGQKRHYWGEANKNFGFYTSDQLQQLSKRIKTQGNDTSNYRQDKALQQSNFYCVCHKNQNRYKKSSERCKFCAQNSYNKYSNRVSQTPIDYFNKQQQSKINNTYGIKQVQDKSIQVILPRIYRHTHKLNSKCQVCLQKIKQRQYNSVSTKSAIQIKKQQERKILNKQKKSYKKIYI